MTKKDKNIFLKKTEGQDEKRTPWVSVKSYNKAIICSHMQLTPGIRRGKPGQAQSTTTAAPQTPPFPSSPVPLVPTISEASATVSATKLSYLLDHPSS